MQFYTPSLIGLLLPIALFALDVSPPLPQKVVILLGPPASGKGTQAIDLSKKLALPHISTGDILRANISANTPLGTEAKKYMDQGQLVPDQLVLSMLFDRIEKEDAKKGYILDGFPRTIAQAEALDKHLPKNATITVLNLEVSDDTILKRALGRQRSDDTPEVVKARLKAYYDQTAPLIDYYSKKGLLHPIDGEKSPTEVQQKLVQILNFD